PRTELKLSRSNKLRQMVVWLHNHATKTWVPTWARLDRIVLPCDRPSHTRLITAPGLCYRRPRQFHLSESSSQVRARSESGRKAHADHRQSVHLRPAKFAVPFRIARCGDEPTDVAGVDIHNARRQSDLSRQLLPISAPVAGHRFRLEKEQASRSCSVRRHQPQRSNDRPSNETNNAGSGQRYKDMNRDRPRMPIRTPTLRGSRHRYGHANRGR